MFTATVKPIGGHAFDLTPDTDSVTFSTLANGGFGSCTFRVPLDQLRGGANRIPKLSHVQLMHGAKLLWEGRVEDHDQDFIGGSLGLSCFGYQRLLDDTSLKRIWLMRTIPWQLVNGLAGISDRFFNPSVWAWTTLGRFDDTDLARAGIKFSSQTGQSAAQGTAHGAWFWTDAPITRLIFRHRRTTSDPADVSVYDSPNGTTWTLRYSANAVLNTYTTATVTLGAGAQYIRVIAWFSINLNNANCVVELDEMRLLGAINTEDVVGGFYPHTLLSDVIDQVPELSKGVIERDTSFALPQLSRLQRDRALSVVQEIGQFFQRHHAVWEDRRFHWTSPNLEIPHWVLHLNELTTCNLTSSVDNTAKDLYLTYGNVATGLPEERSSTSTDRRNPFVRAGVRKDEVLAAPVGMTGASAQQLVNRVSADHGSLPSVRGQVTLPADTLVESVQGQRLPAYSIRAGENVLIPELPKDDLLDTGRDSQTLFHVTATSTDMTEGRTTTLELEGYTRSSEVLMARIGAATRVLTG